MSAPPSTEAGSQVHQGTQRGARPRRRRADSTQNGTAIGGTMPARKANHGSSSHCAGLLLALFNIAGLVGGLLAPVLSDRVHDRRRLTLPATAAVAFSLTGLLRPTQLRPSG